MKKYILALDQGTTSSRAVLFDKQQHILEIAQKEITQYYPQNGWVEHDPMEIYSSQYAVMAEVITKSGIDPAEIAAIGITNQRETTIVWDRTTGKPIYNAIVWQCRRTADITDSLITHGLSDYIHETTGLLPDAYFSATKIMWILENIEGAREKAERGELCFGTVDSWLIWQLSGHKLHITDYTNASRTMLFNIHTLNWDKKLLQELHIPYSMLPQVCDSSGVFCTTSLFNCEIPIASIVGDQQAALFGQACFTAGEIKNTYGTGCFMLMNTGDVPVSSKNGLITTIASGINGKISYALEGSVFVGGAVIQWLRDELRLFSESCDAEYYARKVSDSGGVYLVPAFTGIGAPYWDMYARGCIVGLTRATTREHIIRAAEESIAFQTYDLMSAMESDVGHAVDSLKVDGGASRDDFLLQFQADILNKPVLRPVIRETTALGAASLAGLAVQFWSGMDEVRHLWQCNSRLVPSMSAEQRKQSISGWHKAVSKSCGWMKD